MITHGFHKHSYVKKSNGSSLLYLRVTINRNHQYYELYHITSKLWDKAKQRLKPIGEDSAKINADLDQEAQKVNSILVTIHTNHLAETFETFERLYLKNGSNLFGFWDEIVKKCANSGYDSDTIRLYGNSREHLFNYTKTENIELSDVDYDFLDGWDQYLRSTGMMINTKANQHKRLNKVLNDAKRQGLVIRNPYERFKIQKEKTTRTFLVDAELQRLVDLYNNKVLQPNYQHTLQAFLFSCFTGLRHSDTKNLKYCNIIDNSIDIMIEKKSDNGHKRLLIPLSKQAMDYIDPMTTPNSKVFPNLITATKARHHLKAMAVMIHINKNLSYHVSRHTFATLSLGLGIDIKKVSELLGHDSVRTTEIYSHLVEAHLRKAVDKWDGFNKDIPVSTTSNDQQVNDEERFSKRWLQLSNFGLKFEPKENAFISENTKRIIYIPFIDLRMADDAKWDYIIRTTKESISGTS